MLNAHFLHGEEIGSLSKSMRGHPSNILRYFRKQVFYRFVWDLMRTSRSFFAMFRIIQAESEGFITQFCDSKDK